MEMGSIKPIREQGVSREGVAMRDQTHPSVNDRVVSAYEVPTGTLVKQDLSATTDLRVSVYEVPVMTLQREQEKTGNLSMISDVLVCYACYLLMITFEKLFLVFHSSHHH